MKNRVRSAGVAVLAMGTFTLACGGPAPSSETAAPAVTEPVASTTLPATDPIQNAMSAGPSSISTEARIMDWNFDVIREGSNAWTCLPDRPNTSGNDPWCVTEAWLDLLRAYVNKTEPTYTTVGFAYMLQGDTPVSNSDPFATEETGPEDWVTHLGPHLMMLLPNRGELASIPTEHLNGGPWVMWPDTPYAHIRIRIESREPMTGQ